MAKYSSINTTWGNLQESEALTLCRERKGKKADFWFLTVLNKIKLQFHFLIVIQKAKIGDQQNLYVFKNNPILTEFGHEELLHVVAQRDTQYEGSQEHMVVKDKSPTAKRSWNREVIWKFCHLPTTLTY